MADLFWPGDHRAGQLMSDAAFLAALVRVENAWLNCLLAAGVAPEQARTDLAGLISAADSAVSYTHLTLPTICSV